MRTRRAGVLPVYAPAGLGWDLFYALAKDGVSPFQTPVVEGRRSHDFMRRHARGVTFLAPAGQGCDFFMHQQTYMQAFYAPAGQGVTFLCTRAGVSPFHAPAGDTLLCTSIVGMDQLGRYVTSPCARIAGVLFFYAPAGRRCHFLMHPQGSGATF